MANRCTVPYDDHEATSYPISLLTVLIIAVLPPYDSTDCVECPLGARCSDGKLTSFVPVRSNLVMSGSVESGVKAPLS